MDGNISLIHVKRKILMNNSRKCRVYSNDNIAIVGSLRNYLAQYDIQAEIRNEFSASVMPELGFSNAWPELWVFEDDLMQAKELLEKATTTSKQESGEDWLCKYCREENPSTFEVCWQCARTT